MELRRIDGDATFTAPDGFSTRLRTRPGYAASAGGARVVRMIEDADAEILRLLDGVPALHDWIRSVPASSNETGGPQWRNDHLPAFDAVSIALMLAAERPDVYFEIGSGNSTRFARSAIRHLGLKTRIVSVDPHPREDIDGICDHIIRSPLEDAAPEALAILRDGPLVFFDGSHRTLPNSDVTVFFIELLPELPAGCVYGVHDICLPLDYAPGYAERFYSEQYLLHAYLIGGADGDAIALPVSHESYSGRFLARMPEDVALPTPWGNAFWMRRKPLPTL
ncbi:class I SAM-dependent methyltransferase [Alsobacter sp. SYSU BS001988]